MPQAELVDNEIWSSTSTDVGGIEKALHRLRLSVRNDDDEGVPQQVTETAVLNIVVSAQTQQLLEEACDIVAQLSQRHPSRSIFFLREPEAADNLAADVNAFCTFMPGAPRQVCCEQIRVTASGSYAQQLHSIARPLLLPDIPTFVWWRGQPPLATPMYDRLREMASRMVVDSSGFRGAFIELSREALQCQSAACALSDLAWGRLEGWREQVARLFDPPDTRAYLARLDSVHINTATADYPTEAILLLGWLAAQLSWRLDAPMEMHDDQWSCSFQGEGGPISCTIEGVAEEGLEGLPDTILSLELSGGGGSFTLTADPSSSSLQQRITIDGRVLTDGGIGMQAPALLQVLSRELELLERDAVYERAVAMGARLSGA